MLGVGEYFWRLIPGNPILLRVVDSGGKRKRDLFIRCAYLAFLVIVVCVSLATSGDTSTASLGALAKTSADMFQKLSYVQLGLIAMLSPIFTAGAITQEKDSQTYDILLATPLTNGQIVLGSLLSRLFFIIALLISGIPVFSITQVFGGVAIKGIAMSFGIAAATAFFTGAMAMAIATFKVGTRRTIFSFYLVIIIYLVGVFFLDRVPALHPSLGVKTNGAGVALLDDRGNQIPILSKTSWLTGIHPFLALRVIFNDPEYTPPDLGALPANLRGWPTGWYLSRPQSFYISFFFFLSFLLVMPSIMMLRRVAQSSTTIQTRILQLLRISSGDKTRKPRGVWTNPIAWREAKTKASAARATFVRYSFMILGVGGAITLAVLYSKEEPPHQYVDTRGPTASAGENMQETLTVYDNDKDTATTYALAPSRVLTLSRKAANELDKNSGAAGDGETVDLPKVLGKLAVDSNSLTFTNGTPKLLQTITLRPISRKIAPKDLRMWLTGAIIVEFAGILLIVTNAAASTVTREKEDGTLDLLLTTPITSKYYIWGKLRGLVSFVLPLVGVPLVSAMIFVMCDFARVFAGADSTFQWIVFPEAVIVLPGTMVIVAAFAAILGMQMSLRCRTTVWAVMSSIGIVLGAVFGLSFCGFSMLDSRNFGAPALAFGSFSPFTLISILIDPAKWAHNSFDSAVDQNDIVTNRVVIFVCGWIATGTYTLIVWLMYKSMVKNFDMTIRRQSR